MKKYIFGMSKSRRDLGAWIEDHTFPAMCVLAQLYLFPNVSTRKYWRQELWSKFNSMHILRGTNKLPSATFIYDNSWGVNENFVQDAVNWAIVHEENLTPIDYIDVDELSAIMGTYFDWLSKKLSKSKFVLPKDVYETLDGLGLTE